MNGFKQRMEDLVPQMVAQVKSILEEICILVWKEFLNVIISKYQPIFGTKYVCV